MVSPRPSNTANQTALFPLNMSMAPNTLDQAEPAYESKLSHLYPISIIAIIKLKEQLLWARHRSQALYTLHLILTKLYGTDTFIMLILKIRKRSPTIGVGWGQHSCLGDLVQNSITTPSRGWQTMASEPAACFVNKKLFPPGWENHRTFTYSHIAEICLGRDK